MQYNASNLFDIDNIPLSKKDGNKISILSYKEATDLIKEKSKDSKFDIEYYAQDDRIKYTTDLMSFNISQDEWKNIIAKINGEEGGVIEIFERCKTSQQLMHDWMIKTVEKTIYKDQEDQKKLESMLENLVDEMISNEQYIHEKSVLEEFSGQISDLSEDLESLINSYDKQKNIESELAGMNRYLATTSERIRETIEINNDTIEEQSRMIKVINLEERSLAYHKEKHEFERLQAEHESIKKELDATNSRLEDTKKKRDIQKAAKSSIILLSSFCISL